MPKSVKKIGIHKHILYPLDVSDKSSHAKEIAVLQDMRKHFGSQLSVITVLPDYGASIVAQYFSKVAEETLKKDAKKALKAFVKEHFDNPDDINLIVAQGGIYERIIEAAREVKADVIVMTAHRPGLQDYLLGPNAAKVVRHSEISVLVIRED